MAIGRLRGGRIATVAAFSFVGLAGYQCATAQNDVQPAPNLIAAAKPPEMSMRIPPSKLVNFDRKNRVKGKYIIVFRNATELAADQSTNYKVDPSISPISPEGTSALALALARKYGLKVNRIYKTPQGLRGLEVTTDTEDSLADLAQDPRVKYIEPVLIGRTQTTMNIQSSGAPNCTQSYCASNCYPGPCAPWDLDRIDQVWNIDGLYHYVSTGAGVTIWIPDTGLQIDHSEFSGRNVAILGPSPFGFSSVCDIDGQGNVVLDCVFADVTGSLNFDPAGHGTVVASIAAGNTLGVAKSASIDGIQVCQDDNDCYLDFIAAGIDFAIANRSSGPNILLMAIEFEGGSAVADDTVNRALAAGFTAVVAAGNFTQSACNSSPSDVSGAIKVAATDFSNYVDSWSSDSDYGVCVDLLAPGVLVWAADNAGNGNVPDPCGNNFVALSGACVFSGTSVSAPLVGGIAALYLQNYPSSSPSTVKSALLSAAASVPINGIPNVPGNPTPNLIASVWVPGNTTGAQPPGGGYPPFGGGTVTLPPALLLPIVNLSIL